jgi:hypothetical protein
MIGFALAVLSKTIIESGMPPFLLTQCIRVAMVAEKEGELHRYEALIVNRTLVLTLLRADDQALSLHSIAVQEVQRIDAHVCVALTIFQDSQVCKHSRMMKGWEGAIFCALTEAFCKGEDVQSANARYPLSGRGVSPLKLD